MENALLVATVLLIVSFVGNFFLLDEVSSLKEDINMILEERTCEINLCPAAIGTAEIEEPVIKRDPRNFTVANYSKVNYGGRTYEFYFDNHTEFKRQYKGVFNNSNIYYAYVDVVYNLTTKQWEQEREIHFNKTNMMQSKNIISWFYSRCEHEMRHVTILGNNSTYEHELMKAEGIPEHPVCPRLESAAIKEIKSTEVYEK